METRFFCEGCGNDVPFNTEVCPYCGRIFLDVKCPICGVTGTTQQFLNGCPSCGFMSPAGEIKKKPGNSNVGGKKKKRKKTPVKVKGLSSFWVIIGVLFLCMVLAALGFLFMR